MGNLGQSNSRALWDGVVVLSCVDRLNQVHRMFREKCFHYLRSHLETRLSSGERDKRSRRRRWWHEQVDQVDTASFAPVNRCVCMSLSVCVDLYKCIMSQRVERQEDSDRRMRERENKWITGVLCAKLRKVNMRGGERAMFVRLMLILMQVDR